MTSGHEKWHGKSMLLPSLLCGFRCPWAGARTSIRPVEILQQPSLPILTYYKSRPFHKLQSSLLLKFGIHIRQLQSLSTFRCCLQPIPPLSSRSSVHPDYVCTYFGVTLIVIWNANSTVRQRRPIVHQFIQSSPKIVLLSLLYLISSALMT